MSNSMKASHLAKVWGLRLLLFAVIVIAWVFGTNVGGISTLILPKITDVLRACVELLGTADIWARIGVTVLEMVIAFLIAASAGLVAGFLLSRREMTGRVGEILLSWGYMFPIVLLYPMFLLWTGVGIESKILYGAVNGFFPIAYNVTLGLRNVEERYLKVGRAFRASPLHTDMVIKMGAARPMILSGLRLGVALVTISVVVAELLGSTTGLGNALQEASTRFNAVDQYALTILLIALTAVLQVIMERALRSRHG